MMIEAGLCLALQEDELPIKSGGLMAPSAGLGDVLMDRLQKTGTSFQAQGVAAPLSKL